MDTEYVFDFILRNPLDHSTTVPNSSLYNFTIEMRYNLAQSLRIDGLIILLVRETPRISSSYYSSLENQLIYFFV